MAANDIKDRESLERWLKRRPVLEARVLAVRATLRALPFIEDAVRPSADSEMVPLRVFVVFMNLALARCVATYPQREGELAPAVAAAAAAAAAMSASTAAVAATATSASDIVGLSVATALTAATARCAACACANTAEEVIANGVDSIVMTTDAGAFASDCETLWEHIRWDAKAIEGGEEPSQVSQRPLWLGDTPVWAKRKWALLASELAARSVENWDVWIDWYDERILGVKSRERDEIERTPKLTEQQWKVSPAVANKKIKEIIARHRTSDTSSAMIAARIASNTMPAVPARAALRAPLFISHASQADGAAALALAQALEAAGQPCWLAPRDIPPGADWNGSIIAAIEACAGMILLVSDAAIASKFVAAEVQHAFEQGKRIMPVRLASAADPGRIDLRLKVVQHIDGRGQSSAVVAAILALG